MVEIRRVTIVCLLVLSMSNVSCSSQTNPRKPNIILFLADDLGYGDLSVYGHPSQEWGPVDQMATEGIRFTNWYANDNVCTPSRAALMTGRFPFRSGMIAGSEPTSKTGEGRWARVILETASVGLPKEDVTVAEALKEQGYATGMVGKWHLGINEFNSTDGGHLPHRHGFDDVGTILPFTLILVCTEDQIKPERRRCFIYKNQTILQQPIDLSTLTEKFVADAKDFIYDNRKHPFFFFFSFAHTHAPMFTSKKFRKSSRRGRYGSNVNEMAWAVGEITQLLKDLNLHKDTLTLFTSDHGPAAEFCSYGGSAGAFKGGKWFGTEGGLRVPMIVWWPGTIKPGIKHTIGSHVDLLPTFVQLANGTLPAGRVLDGWSRKDVLLDNEAIPLTSKDNDALLFYVEDKLHSVRFKSYKVYYYTCGELPDDYFEAKCKGGVPNIVESDVGCGKHMQKEDPPIIFNVDVDPSEKFALDIEKNIDILEEIRLFVAKHEKTTSDRKTPKLNGQYRHSSLVPCCNPPYCFCNYRHNTG